MATVWLSPAMNDEQFFDNNGVVLNGGHIRAYVAGSMSVAQSIYTSAAGTTPWLQPIVLDSSGRIQGGSIWLDSSLAYNLVLYMPDGITVLRNVDNVTGVPIISASSNNETIWVPTVAPSFINGTQFVVVGSLTAQFAVGNRVQLQFTGGGFQYGTVTAVSFSTGSTYVTIQNDAGPILSSLTGSWYSILNVQGPTVDAGAVSYSSALPYTAPNTVGGQLKLAQTAVTTLNNEVANLSEVFTTTGVSDTYVLTPTFTPASYAAGASFNVKFHTASTSNPTINVAGLGAIYVRQYDNLGNRVAAQLITGQTSVILYDGSFFMLQNPVPPPTVHPTNYTIVQNGGTGTSRTVFLTAGTWQLSLQTFGMDHDDLASGNSNYTVSQTATLVTVGNISTAFQLYRSGGAGYGRNVGGMDTVQTNYNLLSDANFSVTLSAMVTTGSGTGNFIPKGAVIRLEKLF